MTMFIKKIYPKSKCYLSDGSYLTVEEVDRVTGVAAISDPRIIGEIRLAIQQQRGGITEISEAEFNALRESKKNATPSPRPWREEWKKGTTMSDTKSKPQPSAPPAQKAGVVEQPEPDRPVSRSQAGK